jgi:hypothetical protein
MKRIVALSLSTVLILNALPAFAELGEAQSSDVQALKQKSEEAAIQRSSRIRLTSAQILELAKKTDNQLYVEISNTLESFKTQRKALEQEQDPILQVLMKVQLYCGLVNAVATNSHNSSKNLDKARYYASSLATLVSGATDFYRQMREVTGHGDVKMKEILKAQLAKLQASIKEDQGDLPKEAKDLSLALAKMELELERAGDVGVNADRAGYAKWASALAVIAYMGAHILAPKAVEAGEAAIQKAGTVRKHLQSNGVLGSNRAGYLSGAIEYLGLAAGYNTEEAQKLIAQVQTNLDTAIAAYEEISKIRVQVAPIKQ